MDGTPNETLLIAGNFAGDTDVTRHERGLGGGLKFVCKRKEK